MSNVGVNLLLFVVGCFGAAGFFGAFASFFFKRANAF